MQTINTLTNALTRPQLKNNSRVFTPKALATSGLKVIDQHHDTSVDIIVYEDGSVDYCKCQHRNAIKFRNENVVF